MSNLTIMRTLGDEPIIIAIDKQNNGTFILNNYGVYSDLTDYNTVINLIKNLYKTYSNLSEEKINSLNKELRAEGKIRAEKEMEKQKKEMEEYKNKNRIISNKKGYVYFVKGNKNIVKIGCTTDIKNRIKSLSTGFPYKLKLLNKIYSKNYGYIEGLFHEFFKNKRLRGEWFDLSDEEIYNIKKGLYPKNIIKEIGI